MSEDLTLEERLEAAEEVVVPLRGTVVPSTRCGTRAALEPLFAPNVVVHAAEELRGREAILEYIQRFLDSGLGVCRHSGHRSSTTIRTFLEGSISDADRRIVAIRLSFRTTQERTGF